ncbi:MAG: hypothetical protein K2K84_02100 [Muribaculaceae bacterium]|nr:hypothetical protein [Muribaculaceae bacterium]
MKNNSGSKASKTTQFSFADTLDSLFPPVAGASSLMIACPREDYSASRISRAVEDADAHVLNLNVTSMPAGVDELVVELRIDHRNPVAAAGSLERYGYRVIGVDGEMSELEDTNRRRVDEFLRYLDV